MPGSKNAKQESGKSFLNSLQLQLPFLSSFSPSVVFSGDRKPEMSETLSFPFPLKFLNTGNKMNSEDTESLRREAVQFFCGIMVRIKNEGFRVKVLVFMNKEADSSF